MHSFAQTPLTYTTPAAPAILQRACDCSSSSGSGNCSADKQLGVQPKLTLGPQNDIYEQEADRIADRVVSGRPIPAQLPAITQLQRQTSEEKEGETAQAKADTSGMKSSAGAAAAAAAVASGGQPLSRSDRTFFEPRFGRDLSNIRLHTDATAARAAKNIGARAYTLRNHIAFSAGQYSPSTFTGRRLLAHELTHTLQQNTPGTIRRQENGEGIQTEQPAPTQTNTCGCDPPPTTLCTGNNQNMVLAAFNQAAQWLPNAQRHIEDYRNASSNQRSSMPAAAPLRDHFRWPAGPNGPLTPTPNVVARVINHTLSNIEKPICANCQEECPCTGQGLDVFACSPGAWHNSNCYEFCEPFFAESTTDTLRAKIVLHEMMHSWERMGDTSYEGDPNYPPNAHAAQVNADSFANLIRDLG